MVLILLGSLLSILIPIIIYRHILKGHNPVNGKLYIHTFLLSATLYTIPIIILELLWDAFFKGCGATPVIRSLNVAFLRAALLEEAVKYYFSYRVVKRNPELGLREAILLAGIVGIGYGFTEKLAYANGMAMILSSLTPVHMALQWFMGFCFYKALRIDGRERKKYYITAYIVPFLIHGIWDFSLDITDFLLEAHWILQLLGVIFVLTVIITTLAAIAAGAKKIHRLQEKSGGTFHEKSHINLCGH